MSAEGQRRRQGRHRHAFRAQFQGGRSPGQADRGRPGPGSRARGEHGRPGRCGVLHGAVCREDRFDILARESGGDRGRAESGRFGVGAGRAQVAQRGQSHGSENHAKGDLERKTPQPGRMSDNGTPIGVQVHRS